MKGGSGLGIGLGLGIHSGALVGIEIDIIRIGLKHFLMLLSVTDRGMIQLSCHSVTCISLETLLKSRGMSTVGVVARQAAETVVE